MPRWGNGTGHTPLLGLAPAPGLGWAEGLAVSCTKCFGEPDTARRLYFAHPWVKVSHYTSKGVLELCLNLYEKSPPANPAVGG